MTTLAGKTLFITGASRGIGKAIALRAAKDGANVVVVAKTAEPHPKLPGTVYSAVEEIEAAGGKGLACICDIRFEEQVEAAVAQAAEQFGGIDIVINNASAISLTDTPSTSLKRFDLMHGVNVRGTFLTTQKCLPHLRRADNPHILTMSPPLNMETRWFAGHVAYSMSKFGMSMCTLGWAGELKQAGIAANALWPRTAIDTAAVRNLLGGQSVAERSRSPQILADAAHVILTRDSKAFTGNFCIDDEVLASVGKTDLSEYASVPDDQLTPDFFV